MNDKMELFLKTDSSFMELQLVVNRHEMSVMSSTIIGASEVSRFLKIRKKHVGGSLIVSKGAIERLASLGNRDVREDIYVSGDGGEKEVHVAVYFIDEKKLGLSAFFPGIISGVQL